MNQTHNRVSPPFSADSGPGPFLLFPAMSQATCPSPGSDEPRFPATAPFVLPQVCLGPEGVCVRLLHLGHEKCSPGGETAEQES